MLECTLSQPQTKKSYYRHNFVMLLADAFTLRSHIQCTRTLYVCMAKDAQSLGTVWWFVHALKDYSNFEACFSSFKLVFAQQKQSLLGPGHTGETQLQFLHFLCCYHGVLMQLQKTHACLNARFVAAITQQHQTFHSQGLIVLKQNQGRSPTLCSMRTIYLQKLQQLMQQGWCGPAERNFLRFLRLTQLC